MSLVKASAKLGAAEINSIHLPDDDKLSRAEVLRHLTRCGIKYPEKWLRFHEQAGLVHRHKKGERNSKVSYSLVELQRLIVSDDILRLFMSYY